ncbi:MAG: hypothetical protein JJE52_08190 [Acidimicrobiia bacterium]|nr:hypothetical protein [Acidimicrobiia bacterium]
MATTGHREIMPTTEARARLSQILAEFERDGVNAEPVAFGSHRRPQGVIIGWDLWLEILPAIEDHLDATEAGHRLDRAGDERVTFEDAADVLGRDPHTYR